MSEFSVGQIVRLNESDIEGTVRYVGVTRFSPGTWVGVELVSKDGKNDGSVEGIRYFNCEMSFGIFLRPSNIQLVTQPSSLKWKGGGKKIVRHSSVSSALGRRLSHVPDTAVENRLSMNAASPSPAGGSASRTSSILRSPNKSPTRKFSTSSLKTPLRTPGMPFHDKVPSTPTSKLLQSKDGYRSHSSMPPPPRPETTNPRTLNKNTTSQSSFMLNKNVRIRPSPSLPPKPAPRVGQRVGSISRQPSSSSGTRRSSHDSVDEMAKFSTESRSLSPRRVSPGLSKNTTPTIKIRGTSTAVPKRNKSPSLQRSNDNTGAAAARIIEDLETTIRVMDKRLTESREKMKALEKLQEEKDKYEAIIQKMQLKYQPYQKEVVDLRKQLKEADAKIEEVENKQAEYDLVLEMAMLDREMAEETAEVLKTELEAMRLKNEELELEVEVQREENRELGSGMSPEEKNSQGWLQMERSNERMREALIRLRDMTQQTESELRNEVKSLQDDLQSFGSVKEHYELTKEKLSQSEAAIEDLKQQLDNAIGAEVMIEELTEKNMGMQEEIEELRATITDFETLKEISDEVEINHVEIEKDMQNEIDFKENLIIEQKRRATQQDQVLSDMEYTLSRFRELVSNLQNDLDDLRVSHAITETEAGQLNSRSRAMLDFNMKLQVSVAKTQLKTIDLELRRLDAQEALEHLAIVQLFLPDAFSVDRDSVLALLRFKRVGFKARLLHGFVKEKVNSQLPPGLEDDIFAACDVLDKLSWVGAMCDRFVGAISYCSINEFTRYKGALYELEPVERALNVWIDSLGTDEFKGKQCGSELQRLIALLSHLADVHITGGLESYANEVYMKSVVMQSHLENAATAMISMMHMVQAAISGEGDQDDLAQNFSRKCDSVTSQIRSAKVIIGKAIRALEDLNTRSLSLTPDTLQMFEDCEKATGELAAFSRLIGDDLLVLLQDEARSEPFTYFEIQSATYRTTSNFFASSESELFLVYTNKIRSLINSLTDLSNLASDLGMTQEFERAPAPWLLRSQELKKSKAVPVDAAEEIRRLKDDNLERAKLIAIKDQALEETSVKIELLQSRMRDATKKNEKITELERWIEAAKQREHELTESLEYQNKEVITWEAECEKWKKVAEDAKSLGVVPHGSKAGQELAVATARELEILNMEIESLQAAIRFLRSDSRHLHQTESQNMDWLEAPLIKVTDHEDQYKALVFSEGQEVLSELLNLSSNSRVIDLKAAHQNRSGWRPAKSTPQYYAAKQREDYAAWCSWKDDFIEKAKMLDQRHSLHKSVQKSRTPGTMAAQVRLSLPEWENKSVMHEEVTIVEPNEFESFRETLGFV